MTIRRISHTLAVVAMTTATAPLVAQHFAKPLDIDRSNVPQVGQPAFTLSNPSTSFGSAVDGDWLYILGGYTGRPHDYYREAQLSDFYRVNLRQPSHIETLPNELRVQSCPLEHWSGSVIRTGGMTILNAQGEEQTMQSLVTVEAYDTDERTWRALPNMPSARSSHDTAVVDSTLYAVGGWTLNADGESRSWADTMIALDLNDLESGWRTYDMPFKRRALASVAINDMIMVIGGITADGDISQRVDLFDTDRKMWTSGPEFPSAAFGVAAEVVGDRVVASGSDGNVYTWREGQDVWEPLATLTFPRFFHQIAADMNGDLLFFGGISRGVRPIHAERISLNPTAFAPAGICHWTIPSPSPAKNRQAIFVEDGWLYTFGGNNSTGQHDFESDNFLANGYRLSLANLQWRPVNDLPVPRQSMQTTVSPDGASWFAFGGFAHDGDVARTWRHGFMFNVKEQTWTPAGEVLPVPRSQFGTVQHDGHYWVFGGLDYDPRREKGDQFRHLVDIVTADSASDQIQFHDTDIDLPSPRRAFGGAMLDGRYYLVGGMREDFQVVRTCDVFDFESQSFMTIPIPSKPRLSPDLVALDGRLYLIGGSSPKSGGGFEPNRTIEAFDPELNAWSTVTEDLPINPRHMRAMAYRGRLLLFSTHVDEASLAHVILIDPMHVSTASVQTVQAEME
ncbi:MAG: hypothetical protein AAF432_09965 [Planctomycetota bacterium]